MKRHIPIWCRWGLVLFVLAIPAFYLILHLTLPGILEQRLSKATGLKVDISDLQFGTTFRASEIRFERTDEPGQFVLNSVLITPAWKSVLGETIVIEEVRVSSVEGESLEPYDSWLSSASAKPAATSWRIRKIAVEKIHLETDYGILEGHLRGNDVRPGSWGHLETSLTLDTDLLHASFFSYDGPHGEITIDMSVGSLGGVIQEFSKTAAVALSDTLAAGKVVFNFHRPAVSQRSPMVSTEFNSKIPTEVSGLIAKGRLSTSDGDFLLTAHVDTLARSSSFTFVTPTSFGTVNLTADTYLEAQGHLSFAEGSVSFDSGRFFLRIDPQNQFRILPESYGEIEALSYNGNNLGDAAAQLSGTYDTGYTLNATGVFKGWRLDWNPAAEEATISGGGRLPSGFGYEKLNGEGKGKVVWHERSPTKVSWNGRLNGNYRAGNISARFQIYADVRVEGNQPTGSISRLSAQGHQKATPWSMDFRDITISRDSELTAISLGSDGLLTYADMQHTISGDILAAESRIRSRKMRISEIPINFDIHIRQRALEFADVVVEQSHLSHFGSFLPSPFTDIWNDCEIDGSLGGSFRYTADNVLAGHVELHLDKLLHNEHGFEIKGLHAQIPIEQKFVDPGTVKFDHTTRWPDIADNFQIERISRHGISATDITGVLVFSDYVLRGGDMRFRLIDAPAKARVVIDPFRSADNRLRTMLEIQASDLSLRSLYEAFIGTGRASESLRGSVDLFLETAWSDTECLESRGVIAGKQGQIGAPVIKALVKDLPKAKRPPDLALFLVGTYKYETLQITLNRVAELNDFLTTFRLESPREMFLNRLDVEAPLLKVIEKMPYEVKSDIRLNRSGES